MLDTPAPRDPGQGDPPPGVPPGPGDGDYPRLGSPGWRLVPSSPDWLPEEVYASDDGSDDPGDDADFWEDPESGPPPWLDDAQLAALIAEAREVTAERAAAAAEAAATGQTAIRAALEAMTAGRRGPGMPGSAETCPGEYAGPAAGFASGKPLDTAAGCAALGSFLEDLAGPGDRCAGASDDELLGMIAGWDRVQSNAAARKLAAMAELIRRRPAPGCALEGLAQMPESWSEFTGREAGAVLGLHHGDAEALLGLAHLLEVSLSGTKALFRSGVLSQDKAEIIARYTMLLDPAEARAAEAKVLDQAGSLTPGQLRAAIKRAVMEVNPAAARKRREHMAKRTRVERWAEDSGNAGLAGREMPPAEVLAADQRVTAWAKELRKAGLEGSMDQLRARAYLDILLGVDSRPPGRRPEDQPADRAPAPGGPQAGAIPPGFAGHANLTIPLVTLLDLADRPGEMDRIGPIDPDLARDLAGAAARNPRSTWCLTVTDSQGHAIGHGCARPAPASGRRGRAKRGKSGGPGGPDPPGGVRFSLTPADRPGPAGGYGTWRLSTGVPGQRDLLVEIGPLTTEDCDHRHQARGHDPGVMLRHLTRIRYATCTGPGCQRPAGRCDFEHNVAYEAGGRTCLCNGNPKCRFDHRVKQDPGWKVEQLPSGDVRWTMPSGRQYVTEPTRYPI